MVSAVAGGASFASGRFRALLAKGFSASRVAGRIGLRPEVPGRWVLRYKNGADAIAKFGWPTFMFG